MPTKKFLKKKNNITKKNKQSGGFDILKAARTVGKGLEFAGKLSPRYQYEKIKADRRAAKEEKEKNKGKNKEKKQGWPSMKIPKISNPFGPSVKAQGSAILLKKQLETEKKENHKANIELVMKAKKGLDKYKEKGDFLYKLSEKANEDDESHQFIKNNLYYLTLGILETAYEAYDYESKEGKKDKDKEIIKKNINDLTKINNYTNEFENHPKIEKKVIFDQLDLIKMLNNKQKATLKANLFILSLSDLKFKGKDGNNERSILNIIPTNPAKKNEEQNGGGEAETAAELVKGATDTAKDNVEKAKTKPIKSTAAKLVGNAMNQGVKNAAAIKTAAPEQEATPGQEAATPEERRKLLKRQYGSRKLITRPKELTQYIEGEGYESINTEKAGSSKLQFEQNIFLKKILLQQ